MGFAELDSRIILGGLFMRNFDVQFDKEGGVVRMVRADCSPEKQINFEDFYMHHSDDRMPGDIPAERVPMGEGGGRAGSGLT